MLDFNSLAPIETPNPRANYDIAISKKTGRITVSETALTNFNLTSRGFNIYPQQEIGVVVSAQDEQYSSVFVSRKAGSKKSRSFTAKVLFDQLLQTGCTKFTMQSKQTTADGREFFLLVPMEGSDADVDVDDTADTDVDNSENNLNQAGTDESPAGEALKEAGADEVPTGENDTTDTTADPDDRF